MRYISIVILILFSFSNSAAQHDLQPIGYNIHRLNFHAEISWGFFYSTSSIAIENEFRFTDSKESITFTLKAGKTDLNAYNITSIESAFEIQLRVSLLLGGENHKTEITGGYRYRNTDHLHEKPNEISYKPNFGAGYRYQDELFIARIGIGIPEEIYVSLGTSIF